jgi:hypothetical protein
MCGIEQSRKEWRAMLESAQARRDAAMPKPLPDPVPQTRLEREVAREREERIRHDEVKTGGEVQDGERLKDARVSIDSPRLRR